MDRLRNRAAALALALLVTLSALPPARAAQGTLDARLEETAAWLLRAVPEPQVGSIGGEWAVLGLARSESAVPEGYYRDYYSRVETYVTERGGVLHPRKYTEYARVVTALTAIGRDGRLVAGYDLTAPLGDYEKTLWQGLNGPIWALIALDSGDYPMPAAPAGAVQATREGYVAHLLSQELSGGGWTLGGDAAQADITAMALQALAPYRGQSAVAAAGERALLRLSTMQDDGGGFVSGGIPTAESCAQVLLALCQWGVPVSDSRFTKNGRTVVDALLDYRRSGGGFAHEAEDADANQMATEQAFYALTALRRWERGQSGLYDMADAPSLAYRGGLAGKSDLVTSVPVTAPGADFGDLTAGLACRRAVRALAARGIVNGRSAGRFDPEGTMTRAAFAILTVRALGLTPYGESPYSDVADTVWYAPYLRAAGDTGIIRGVGGGKFAPSTAVTRGQAAAMAARAARLCGLETALNQEETAAVLARYRDGGTVPAWVRSDLAFCCQAGLLPTLGETLRTGAPITRADAAELIYRLLDRAELL